MTVALVIVLINSAGIIALAVQIAFAARRERRLTNEVTELQGIVDMLLITQGLPPMYAERYDVEIVLDPTKLPPPDV